MGQPYVSTKFKTGAEFEKWVQERNTADEFAARDIMNIVKGDTEVGKATNATNSENANHATRADTATNATHAVNATYAINATNAEQANTAVSAGSATKATQDGNGDNIANTYAKKNSGALYSDMYVGRAVEANLANAATSVNGCEFDKNGGIYTVKSVTGSDVYTLPVKRLLFESGEGIDLSTGDWKRVFTHSKSLANKKLELTLDVLDLPSAEAHCYVTCDFRLNGTYYTPGATIWQKIFLGSGNNVSVFSLSVRFVDVGTVDFSTLEVMLSSNAIVGGAAGLRGRLMAVHEILE